MEHRDIVNGWQISPTDDGGFGVVDHHGMLAGPFGKREEAIAAALRLPKPGPATKAKARRPDLKDVQPGSCADAVEG